MITVTLTMDEAAVILCAIDDRRKKYDEMVNTFEIEVLNHGGHAEFLSQQIASMTSIEDKLFGRS